MRFVQSFIGIAKRNPFPSIVIAVFLILTVLGISGSSMGTFDQMLTGKTPGVLFGQPRPVRSDEWLWQSQDTLVQKINHFPAVNQKIAQGEDVSMILDVPFRSFFALFKPHNFFFFVLPYANAFAAKWWIMSAVLALGFYFLFDALFPKKRLLVIAGSLLVLFNPFTQWWYQAITLLAIGYALWAVFFIVKLFQDTPDTKRLILYSAGFGYSALCFGFLLYPPFQIPVVYVVTALLAGFFYYRYRGPQKQSLKADKTRWLGVAGALVAMGIIAGAFFITHKQVLHTINHTVYPSIRDIKSGQSSSSVDGANFNLLTILSAPTLYNLQRDTKAIHFYTNQSEAARIAAISLVLLPVVLYQVFKKARSQRGVADYMLLSTTALAGVFMIRMLTPLFSMPFSLILFNKVQNERLAIGLVLLCVVQLVLVGIVMSRKFSLKHAAVAAIAAFLLFYDGSHILAHQYPGFISGVAIFAVSLTMAVCVFLMLQKKFFMVGLALFVAFNIASSAFVNPLYNKSQPVALKDIAGQISSRYTDNKSWLATGSVTFENVPLVAGKQSYSGVQYYPQLPLWQTLDPTKKEINSYNRYSHVIFTTDPLPAGHTLFYSPQPDVLHVKLDCAVAKKLPNLGYVLSSGPIDTQTLTCLTQDGSIVTPGATLYIYKINP